MGGRTVVVLLLSLAAVLTALPSPHRVQALSLSATPSLARPSAPVELRGRSTGARRGKLPTSMGMRLRGGDGGAETGADKPIDAATHVQTTPKEEKPTWEPSLGSERCASADQTLPPEPIPH